MRRLLLSTITILSLVTPLAAEPAPDAAELTKLLDDFLAGASRDDAAIHDRFWADDLVYTGSSGRRVGKADILGEVRSTPAPKPGDPTAVYTAENVRIKQYGDTAIVAFRLVGTTRTDERTEVAYYLNTGTFLKRDGKWQAVAWQATKVPRTEDAARSEVAAVEAALHRAMLSGDVKSLDPILDDSFVWVHGTGEVVARKDLLDSLASGKLKYSKIETSGTTIATYGDTAIVRGTTLRQRSAFEGDEGKGDAKPFSYVYTLTFGNKGDGWKALAMHMTRLEEKQP